MYSQRVLCKVKREQNRAPDRPIRMHGRVNLPVRRERARRTDFLSRSPLVSRCLQTHQNARAVRTSLPHLWLQTPGLVIGSWKQLGSYPILAYEVSASTEPLQHLEVAVSERQGRSLPKRDFVKHGGGNPTWLCPNKRRYSCIEQRYQKELPEKSRSSRIGRTQNAKMEYKRLRYTNMLLTRQCTSKKGRGKALAQRKLFRHFLTAAIRQNPFVFRY